MRQINTYYLYDLGKVLQPLRELPDDPAKWDDTHPITLAIAGYWMKDFLDNNLIPLEFASDAARRLIDAANSLAGKVGQGQKVQFFEVKWVKQLLERFETLLGAELQKQLTFAVSQVGGYSMPLLVNKAEANLEDEAVKTMSTSALTDFKEAGRCLAYGLPTGCGMHTMRAIESMLRRYYKLMTGRDADANNLDWGTCITDLRKSSANKKVVQLLDQIRDLHRNPLMHPEEFLDMKLALRLFDISKSALNALAEQITIEEAKPKTSTASASGTTV